MGDVPEPPEIDDLYDFTKKVEPLPGFDVRYTSLEDGKYLLEWLSDPKTMRNFPMREPAEVEDSAKRWIGFSKHRCSLTATMDGVPCGIATLYLQAYRTLAHQCEFGIIIDKNYRSGGVGTHLMRNLMHLAKNHFRIELLHLQVHGDNPAYEWYERFGFTEFGRQTHWGKDHERYMARIFMERFL